MKKIKSFSRVVPFLLLALFFLSQKSATAAPPQPVSPGYGVRAALLADQTPTFSWSSGNLETTGYEILVFRDANPENFFSTPPT
ncbi:MAG: hypothetical protein JXR80_03945, partial [Deltaproteobacteria bacterium]|nr:hypothetical protein [Deltaproteobacteria bacterium]